MTTAERAPEPAHDLFERYLTTTYAARNDLSAQGLERAARAYERQLGRHLPADRERPILEIGCGAGGFLLCCRELGFTDVRGVDISPQQVEFCRRLGFPDVECAEALAYLRSGHDLHAAIVMTDVLEHLPKQRILPTLEAARERLERSGRLILRVPNMSNPLNLRTRYVDFTHEVGFTVESLAQVLRLSGFQVAEVYGTFPGHRRWLARLLFDRICWRAFRLFSRQVLGLSGEVVRGKNLIAIGIRPTAARG